MRTPRLSITSLLICVFVGSVSVTRASPILNVEIAQNGDFCTLNWQVLDAGPNQGIILYVEGPNQLSPDAMNFLGWFNASSGTLSGTTDQGWMDYPATGADSESAYVPFPSSRFSGIFTDSTHLIEAYFFDAGSVLPYGYSPDGPYGGSGGIWLSDSYTVFAADDPRASAVPDGGVTIGFCGLCIGAVLLAHRKQARKS